MSTEVLDRLATGRATRPPRRWRNWYWLGKGWVDVGNRYTAPCEFPAGKTWPTKEIAEECGLELESKAKVYYPASGLKYLGPRAEDEVN